MDAKTLTLTVDVTHDDIRDGKPDDCRACAVALGLRRAAADVPGVTLVEVDNYTMSLGNGRKRTVWKCHIPRQVAAFIVAFDCCRPVQPFTFVATFEAV